MKKFLSFCEFCWKDRVFIINSRIIVTLILSVITIKGLYNQTTNSMNDFDNSFTKSVNIGLDLPNGNTVANEIWDEARNANAEFRTSAALASNEFLAAGTTSHLEPEHAAILEFLLGKDVTPYIIAFSAWILVLLCVLIYKYKQQIYL
jgi:hypothetical protein